MHRMTLGASIIAATLIVVGGALGIGREQVGFAAFQAATPDTALCATPVSEAAGTPAAMATTTMGTPAAGAAGTPVGLYPCATPVDPGATVEAGAAGEAASATTVEIDMVDIAFKPDELTIPADTDVTIRLVNTGAAVHNFLIEDPEIFSGDVAPGATAEVTVNLPAGTYEFICTVPGHAAAGMVGELTVE